MFNTKVLVTGGSGFLGSNLCRRLLTEDLNVIALDNLSASSIDNISDLLKLCTKRVSAPYSGFIKGPSQLTPRIPGYSILASISTALVNFSAGIL